MAEVFFKRAVVFFFSILAIVPALSVGGIDVCRSEPLPPSGQKDKIKSYGKTASSSPKGASTRPKKQKASESPGKSESSARPLPSGDTAAHGKSRPHRKGKPNPSEGHKTPGKSPSPQKKNTTADTADRGGSLPSERNDTSPASTHKPPEKSGSIARSERAASMPAGLDRISSGSGGRIKGKVPKLDFGGSGAWLLVQMLGMFLALGIVLLLLYIFLRWLSKFYQPMAMNRNSLFQVKDRLALEPKKALWLVELAGEYYLIATSEEGVRLLTKLDRAVISNGLEELEKKGSKGKSFLSLLSSRDKGAERGEAGSTLSSEIEVVFDGKKSNITSSGGEK